MYCACCLPHTASLDRSVSTSSGSGSHSGSHGSAGGPSMTRGLGSLASSSLSAQSSAALVPLLEGSVSLSRALVGEDSAEVAAGLRKELAAARAEAQKLRLENEKVRASRMHEQSVCKSYVCTRCTYMYEVYEHI